ncbi:SgcJ/EcaC family oxidoreductase [Microvirga roseola]|uniref:SgcJ/EcaC family oxidoreductase n=1 Tax=Microvirga roseola TaxID=2883126 RepID=UPI001E4F1199|nr:SgcJ/EcaC family oxidoreductase [Microvirga roseola]
MPRLEEIPDAFMEAWNRHDMNTLAGLFAEDAHFVNVVGMWWTSRAEIAAAHEATHATLFRDSQLSGVLAAMTPLAPGVAALHVTWTLEGQLEPDGSRGGIRRGILLLIATEAADGWTIRVAQNTDIVPGLAAPPALER